MVKRTSSLVAGLVAFVGPPGAAGTVYPARAADPKATAGGEGAFLVLGDWGNPFHPGQYDGSDPNKCWGPHWRCNGCGFPRQPGVCDKGNPIYEEDEYSQTNVADEMVEWATANKAQFLINVGDNFYPGGVKSTEDDMWSYVFEDRYKHPALQIPWFSVLGNHDYGGFQCFFDSEKMEFTHARAQIDYDTEPDWEWPRQKKTRWIMPSEAYKKRVVFDNVTIDLFMIDTNFDDTKDGPAACGHGQVPIPPACNGADRDNCERKCAQIQKQVWSFLEEELPKSDATWKLLVGHHPLPYWAHTRPGGDSINFFRMNNVSAYFCGHVHGMEEKWYSPGHLDSPSANPKPVPGAIFEMQNGAGGGSFPDSSFNGARWGFTGVNVERHSLVITYKGDKNQTGRVEIQPPCVQNWPGTASCAWGSSSWGDCVSSRQVREVWCSGGEEKHCPHDTKPARTQACVLPTPGPSPGSSASHALLYVGLAAGAAGLLLAAALAYVVVRRKRAARAPAIESLADGLASRGADC